MGNKTSKKPEIIEEQLATRKEQVEADSSNRQGMSLLHAGRFQEAADMFDKSLKVRRMLFQENTPEYTGVQLNHAVAIGRLQHRDSVHHYEEVFRKMKEMNLEGSAIHAGGLAHFGRYYDKLGKPDLAVKKMNEAIRVWESIGTTHKSRDYFEAKRDLAEIYVNMEEGTPAIELCDTLLENTSKSDIITRGRIMIIAAKAEAAMGEKKKALQTVGDALMELNKHDPNEPQWLIRQKAEPFVKDGEQLKEALMKELN